MYAIIAHGGKQYRVAPGETLRLERVAGNKGDEVELTSVLMVENEGGLKLGEDLAGAKVVVKVLGHDRAAKVLIFKKKRRKQYRRTKGHRSLLTRVRITDIQV